MTCRDRAFDALPSDIKTRLAARVWAEMRLGRSKTAAKAPFASINLSDRTDVTL